MLQNNILEVFSTSRAIKKALDVFIQKDQILPKTITFEEFKKRAILIKNRVFIDQDTKIFLLQKACDFKEFSELKIPYNYLSFFKNSDIIFDFLRELSLEKIDINKLYNYKPYSLYHRHIKILEKIGKNYISLLDSHGYVDDILLPKIYTLNKEYIKSFDKIDFNVDRVLNSFELELLEKISKIQTIKLNTCVTKYSGFLIKQLQKNFQKDFLNIEYVEIRKNNVQVEVFKQSLLQVSFVKQKVYESIKKGYKAENIVVVLPDSSFSNFLYNFDYENNFCFLSGFSYKTTDNYKKLEAFYKYLEEPNIQNIYRLKRYFDDIDFIYNTKDKNIIKFLQSYPIEQDEIFQEELYLFKKLFNILKDYEFKELFHLFLNRLKKRSIKDNRGGKINVLDINQTSGAYFDVVIIPDFNEKFVPKEIKNDIFLSSEIRKKLSLLTSVEKQNIQKHLYASLLYRAKDVFISYVEDEQNQKSRFLDELELPLDFKNKNVSAYKSIFFKVTKSKSLKDIKDINLYHDLTKVKLSSSKLKVFLDCKRKYYLKYIKKIPEAQLPSDEITPNMVGNIVHESLQELYRDKRYYHDEKELLSDIKELLYKKTSEHEVLKFNIELWINKLKLFAENEIKRFSKDYRVFDVEKEINLKYKDFNLVGKIDRLDIKDYNLFVLDYKTGKIVQPTKSSWQKSTNFQLQFYYHLASSIKDTYMPYYYDLNKGKIIEENFFDEKLKLFDEKLEELKNPNINFIKTDDEKVCLYCPYQLICGRRL